jgi:hypothetical protein
MAGVLTIPKTPACRTKGRLPGSERPLLQYFSRPGVLLLLWWDCRSARRVLWGCRRVGAPSRRPLVAHSACLAAPLAHADSCHRTDERRPCRTSRRRPTTDRRFLGLCTNRLRQSPSAARSLPRMLDPPAIRHARGFQSTSVPMLLCLKRGQSTKVLSCDRTDNMGAGWMPSVGSKSVKGLSWLYEK